MMRIGTGYDVHRLTKDRRLILGGVWIPYEKGHFLGIRMPMYWALRWIRIFLGAAAAGDIGKLLPDTDAKWKDETV